MTIRKRYKQPGRQAFYERLVTLGTPDAVRGAGIFGALLDSFTVGYNGGSLPSRYHTPTSAAWIAYRAGADLFKTRKI